MTKKQKKYQKKHNSKGNYNTENKRLINTNTIKNTILLKLNLSIVLVLICRAWIIRLKKKSNKKTKQKGGSQEFKKG